MKKYFSILFLTIIAATVSNAATITWNGAADNDWHNNANWVGSAKPGTGDYAIINGGAFIVDISTTEAIQGVRVINGTLNITAAGNLTCDAATLPGIWAQGDINNMGVLNITNIAHAGIQLTNKTFVNDGTLTIDGTTQAGINITSNATFNNNGTISINGTSTHGLELGATTCTFNINSGTLNIGNIGTIGARGIFNRGIINTTSGATLNIDNSANAALENFTGAMFTNGGTISIGTITACLNIGIRNYTTFINNGTVTIDMVAFSRLQNENGSTFTNNDLLSLSDGGGNLSINAIGTGSFSNNGTLKGEGIINGSPSNFTNTATVAPGFSPGKQTYQNGFVNSVYEVELASSIHDMLVFSGGSMADFVIAGTLDILLLSGTPTIDQTFKIVDAPLGYTGTFATINYPTAAVEWEIQYNSNDITLRYIGVVAPISLTYFDAKPVEQGVELTWSTSSEINNAGFELQKSNNGKNWNKLDWVNGQGTNGYNIHDYEYIDTRPIIGVNYYRLVQVDLDGTRTQYQMVKAEFTINDFTFKTYPNPVREMLNIETVSNSVNDINVYNNSGEIVKTLDGSHSVINMSSLPSGQYWIEAITGSQKSIKMIVKR